MPHVQIGERLEIYIPSLGQFRHPWLASLRYDLITSTYFNINPIMNQAQKQAAEQEKKEQMDEVRQSMLTQILTPEAKDRLNKIKLVKPEKAQMIESSLIQIAQSGRLQTRISQTQLVQMLEKESQKKAESKITFKRRGLDDDW